MSTNWTAPADFAAVCRRAGGRRRYNSLRQQRAKNRRRWIAALLQLLGDGHGVQARIAEKVGASAATICRDLQALRGAGAAKRTVSASAA